MSKPLFNACSLLVTEQCNLRCTYCFEKHKNNYMDKQTVERSILFLTENAIANGLDSVDITFFGGEPTLNPEAVCHALAFTADLCKLNHLRYGFNMITNAMTLPPSIEESIKTYRDLFNFSVQISMDGTKEVQDRYRVTPNGKGSYDRVVKTIQKYKELYKDRMELLSIHGCLNRESLPLMYESFLHYVNDLGIERTWFLPVAEEDWLPEDVDIYREQTRLITDHIIEEANNSGVNTLQKHAPFDKFNIRCRADKPCGAGVNYCTITSCGDVYPCHQYYFNDDHNELRLGNIYIEKFDEHLISFFQDYDERDLTCKSNCENVSCYRCIAASFSNKKNSLIIHRGLYCQFMKIDNENMKRLREVYEMLTNNNKCNQHTNDTSCGCDVVTQKENVQEDEMVMLLKAVIENQVELTKVIMNLIENKKE